MKIKMVLLALSFLTVQHCSAQTSPFGEPVLSASSILKDFSNFWNYYYTEVDFSEDFVAVNDSSVAITKDEFFKSLISKNFIPLKLHSDAGIAFQLYAIPKGKKDIEQVSKQMAAAAYTAFQVEGKQFLPFNFIDLKGKTYNNENTRGKIIVLKCWFINCVACVQEMPELNRLVKKYKENKEIIFISLAMDNADQLKTFLSKKDFRYEVVPDQRNFMIDTLHINSYPTHIIINKDGSQYKMVANAVSLKKALNKLTQPN